MRTFRLLIFILSFSVLSFSQSYNSYIVKFSSKNELDRYIFTDGSKNKALRFFDKSKIKKNDAILAKPQFNNINEFEKIAIIPKNSDLKNIQENFAIEKIEPNYIYHIEQNTKPNDEQFDDQWALKNINAEFAWKKASGKGIVVGVIDTGIDFEHPDLVNQLWINSKEDINHNGKFDPWSSQVAVKGVYGDIDGIDNDGNGFIDDVIGYDFVDQKKANIGDYKYPDPIPFDEYGHGTMVSGIIAAQHNNKIGISGLAYNSKIMTLRAFDIMGNAEAHNIASAVLYAVVNNVRIINCSFGDKFSSPIVYDAMKFAQQMGCIIIASSGNNGWDDPHYPSDYEGVISVGASDINNKRYGYSNYGDNLAFLAPGANVLSTDYFAEYTKKNGTSFSAPHVSALSALLLEINPSLSADEIKSIIAFSSKMPTTTDWNPFWGAGIIDAGEAVNNVPAMNFSITSPINEQVILRTTQKSIGITGTIYSPLSIKKYSVYVGTGFNPTSWTQIENSSYKPPIINSTIAQIQFGAFKLDTNYTIRLVIEASNGKILEQRRRITIINSNLLKILNISELQAWNNGILTSVVGLTTNMPTKAKIVYTAASGNIISTSDFANESYFHNIKINNPERMTGKVLAKAIVELQDGSSVQSNFTLELNDQYFPIENYNIKKYTIKPSYIFDGATKFYDDNASIIANDLTGGVFGKLYSYNFNPSSQKFEIKDSLNKTLIPVGYGDSNSDGINEVFFKASGNASLFQGNISNKNPFSNIIYDNQFGNFWAQAEFNIDKSAGDELICYSDTAYHIVTFKNGGYQMIAQTKLPSKFRKIGTLPGLALGDFDGDGNNNLAFSNDMGNLFVFKYENNSLNLQFIDSTNYSKSSQYMAALDFDGDGKDEIAILDYSSLPLFNQEEVGDPIWLLRVYKFSGNDSYSILWQTYIQDVVTGSTRNGINIRNGLTAGDIDNDKNKEIIVSTFPNVYSFKYDKDKTAKPQLILKNTFSNNCLIYDFDKNGYKEIGFNDGGATYFAEMNNPAETPETPINFKGNLIDGNTIEFTWDKTANAEFYQLYRAVLNGNFYDLYLLEEVQSNAITIDTFKLDQDYFFILKAVNTGFKNKSSNFSDMLNIHTALPWSINTAIIENKFLKISYKGKLKAEPIEPNLFYILQNNLNKFYPIAVIPASDNFLILEFANIPIGNLKLINEQFLDYWNNTIYKNAFILDSITTINPKSELYLTYFDDLGNNSSAIDPYKFAIYFSEDPDISTIDKNSFKIYTSVDDNSTQIDFDINSLELTADKRGLLFNLSKDKLIFASGKTYFITCTKGKSIYGKEITKSTGNTLAFVITNNDISRVYVYPNPIKLTENYSVYFANLPSRATVEIYNIEMNKIADITESDGNGGVKWDCTDYNGNKLETGIYFFKITNSITSEQSELKKFAIIK